MQHVLDELDRLRRRSHRLLIVQRAAVVLACVLGVVLGLVLVDYALRLPSALRLVLLVAGLIGLGAGIARYFLPACGFRPSLTQLALRAEASLPSLAGRLASSVEFAQAGVDQTNPLAARSVRETDRRLSGEAVGAIIRGGPTFRDVAVLAIVAVVVAVLALSSPALARTGVARLLLPYGATLWPARTAVASLMSEVLEREAVHPRGQALPLRARNLTDGSEGDRVDVHYRMREDGAWGSWQHAVLTHQGAGVHERLVDTNAEAIELYFATEDARTAEERVAIVPPPGFTRATLRVTPPAYAEGRRSVLESELGPGLDDRAVTDVASLHGSRAEIVFELNKPLPVPEVGPQRQRWLVETLGSGGEGNDGAFSGFEVLDGGEDAPTRWRLSWRLAGTRRFAVRLVDEHGLTNREPINYRVTAEPDHVPSVTITEPQSDLAVLATAVVELAGEATDDVAVARLGLRAQVERAGGEGAEDLPFSAEEQTDAPSAAIDTSMDLGEHALAVGDIVLVTAYADDVFEVDGRRHETVVSPVRRLRVIGDLEFAAQLRRQLSAVRQNAIRVESLQGELQEDMIEYGVQPGAKTAQAQLGDRIADQAEAVEELQRQLQRNRLDDEQIVELLQQSQDLLDYAGRASNNAVEAIEQRGPGGSSPDDADGLDAEMRDGRDDAEQSPDAGLPRSADPEDRPIVDAQQDVRDELADLIELLDRDEDTWIVQRQLEGLAEEQEQLAAATTDLAQQTVGESIEDLTETERSELDDIVQRQRELRDQTRQIIEEMRRRAAALEDIDPQAASGMRSAADTGEAREVDRDMEKAAEKASENQLRSAGASQQAASASLQRMLEDLEETRRARAEELLRQLASLIESIDRLIVVQENELIALALAEERGDYTGRDRAMIRLNQNTQAVAVEARSAGQQSRRIARALDRAADAQGAAVVALRSDPVDHAAALEAEDRSLALLKESRALAEELEEEAQQQQVQEAREALIEAYRALAEKQVAVRESTIALAGHEVLDRRQLVEARQLGNAEQEIRSGLADVRGETAEVMDSEVFSYVHQLLDEWTQAASDALWNGEVGIDTTDRQQMIADAIARQIDAIEESITPPEEFADEQAGGQGGGGSGAGGAPPLIPPVAEVKRLHGLQEQVYNLTRGVDRRTDLSEAQRRQRVRDLGRMQRALINLGEKIIESLQQGGAPPGAPRAPDAPGSPDSQEPPEPPAD